MATDKPMQLGMVGLGRMGAGLVRRLMHDGHRCVGYDVFPDAVKALEDASPNARDYYLQGPDADLPEIKLSGTRNIANNANSRYGWKMVLPKIHRGKFMRLTNSAKRGSERNGSNIGSTINLGSQYSCSL